MIRATNKPNRTFSMREKTTPNGDLIYKPGKTTPKEIMCPATRPVTNQNGWEYEVGVASSANIKTPIGKIKVSPQYVERTDSTGTHCYTRIQGSLGTPLIYNISVSYETLVDCATGESIGKGYLTYDESLFFIHLSDGKLSMLFGSSLDKYGITASGGYRMYMLGGY